MLYCPKCQRNYEEGMQRFCLTDGTRLIRAAADEKAPKKTSVGVFSSILGKAGSAQVLHEAGGDKEITGRDRLNKPSFTLPSDSKIFKKELEPEFPVEQQIPFPKPVFRNQETDEILSIETVLDEPKTEKDEVETLSSENPEILLGKTIKERYIITQLISRDENGFLYLAEDKNTSEKNVAIRVLINQNAEFNDKKILEEPQHLSNVRHANLASVLDTGALPEGNLFIVSELIEGESLGEMLERSGQLNGLRAARIIGQLAEALDALHNVGILHRNLKTEDVILTVNEDGAEQIKLTNFGISRPATKENNLAYAAPEIIEGKEPTRSTDIYSLAVIAYQMLTARLPFTAATESDLLKAQREGLKLQPTFLRLDIPTAVDKILEKALAYKPEDRFEKAGDFGKALFGVLSTESVFDESAAEKSGIEEAENLPENEENLLEIDDLGSTPILKPIDLPSELIGKSEPLEEKGAVIVEIPKESAKVKKVSINEVKAAENSARDKIPANEAQSRGWFATLLPILGILLLLTGLWGIWYYFLKRPNGVEFSQMINRPEESAVIPETMANNNLNIPQQATPTPREIEVPPLPREIAPPPDSVYFENSRENLDRNLVRNYRGFSLYYPKNWKKNDTENKFLDISKDAASGTPIEQFLVSYYQSEGTFSKDLDNFPKLVQESNEDLSKILPNYSVVSEGETVVNNGWRAYQVKFKGEGKTKNGENITLWGRRIFIPAARPGVQSGYVVTLFATSLSREVKSVEDVGVKGDSASILNTFEPNQSY